MGIFAACVSRKGDGFHSYDAKLHGYRYYGIWNGRNALAAAFVTEEQLPLTLQHEIFHHVDATHKGQTESSAGRHDQPFRAALAGKTIYPALTLTPEDLEALGRVSNRHVLKDVVSPYCRKSILEDKAETARYLMSHLPDALVQMATQPELPGSQRLLHVLHKYEQAPAANGPSMAWFVDRALGRPSAVMPSAESLPSVIKSIVRPAPNNPYLNKVNKAIADPQVRRNIRLVQPACVRLSNGSGVNLAPQGVILTAGHCVKGVGAAIRVRFPDGQTCTALCTAKDTHLDLAVCCVADAHDLPFAPLAAAAPPIGSWVACIGQPGSRSPKGKPTGYKPFHVSTGKIRGLLDNPLGNQHLGRTQHDAWTYWGHSGSPLFNRDGAIVALHNSWDATTGSRRAVPYQAIVHFLEREDVPFTLAE